MKKVKAGDIVTFSEHPKAVKFEVVRADGFSIEVREAGTDYKTQFSDTSLIAKIIN